MKITYFAIITFAGLLVACNAFEEKKLIPSDYAGKIKPRNSSEVISSPFGIQAGTKEDSLLVKAVKLVCIGPALLPIGKTLK